MRPSRALAFKVKATRIKVRGYLFSVECDTYVCIVFVVGGLDVVHMSVAANYLL